MKTLLLFVAGALLFGAAALGLGYWCWGEEMLPQGGAAFGLTFVPAALSLAWVLYSYRTTPDMRLLAALGGSGFRMAIGLGGGYFLTSAQPEMFGKPFWCWLVLFYLTLLAFEMTLLVRQEPKLDGPQEGATR
jgi:hypothetical protein